MKLVIDREKFAKVMGLAAGVCPTRGVRPSLKNCLIRSDVNRVHVLATDIEVGLRCTVDAVVGMSGEICLPASALGGIAGESGGELVEIETSGTSAKVTLGRDVYEIIGMDTGDFPEGDFPDVPELDAGPTLMLPAGDLARLFALTSHAMAREQGRYAINGLYMGIHAHRLDVVATDGRRLAVARRDLAAGEKLTQALGTGVILPHKLVQVIGKLAADADENALVELGVRGRQLVAKIGDVTVSGLQVDGIFPKYENVVPKTLDREVSFAAGVLAAGLSKADWMTSDESNAIQFTFAADECRLDARSPVKGTAEVYLPCVYPAKEAVTISLNPDMVASALKCFEADELLRLELKDAATPCVLRSGKDFLYVIMPMNQK